MNDDNRLLNEIDALPLPGEPDPLTKAFGLLPKDPGALFMPEVLPLLREMREKDPAGWARVRTQAKKAGVCMPDLDRYTKQAAAESGDDGELFPVIESWPVPVNGAELLDDIVQTITRHIIADIQTIRAVALWVVFTWFVGVVRVAPIANITAPEKRCGKTILLELIAELACRVMPTSNISPAALFRAIEKWTPTLLIDEVDAFLAASDEMRGILNAGFTQKTGYVIRCVGDDHEPQKFKVFGPKVLCGIGKIPGTLEDRSIPLRLRRKLPGETTSRLRDGEAKFAELRRKLARFADDNQGAVCYARPKVIDGLNDRVNDCWEPLLQVAESAGGHWPELARQTAITIHGIEEEAPSIGTELLADIKEIFGDREKIHGENLLEALLEDEEAPWCNWNRGKPMTRRQLTTHMNNYGIKSKDVKIGVITKKGYQREQFKDSWKRYVPDNSVSTATTLPTNNGGACSDISTATNGDAVAEQNPLHPSNTGAGSVVADKMPPTGRVKVAI
jgi:hypothetical protein